MLDYPAKFQQIITEVDSAFEDADHLKR
jgi:hypothetical protein